MGSAEADRDVGRTATVPGLPRLLIINPNTSSHITDLLERAAINRVAGRASATGVSAPFGAASLECEAELVIAAHAVLEAVATAPPADAIIIGAFGDPGRSAAAELVDIPVLGLAQSGMAVAGQGGRRFAIITLGRRMESSIRRAAIDAGFEISLAPIRFLPASILEFAAHRGRFTDLLVASAHAAIADHGAEAILFGGAPFAGIGAEIGDRIPVPVFDGLTSAIDLALDLVGRPRSSPSPAIRHADVRKPYVGISPDLAQLILMSHSRKAKNPD